MASQAEGSGIPWRSPTLHVILASTLMGVMGSSLISPALPAVRDALAITEAQASLILSAFTLPGIVLGPVMGILADRYGRRPVLIPSLIVYGLAGGAVLMAPGLGTVLVLRFIQGMAAAGLITLAITLIGDLFEGNRRNAVMGANGAILAIGTAAYPLIGGALSTIDWRAPFGVYLIGLPAGFLALRALEEPDIGARVTGLDYLRGALREMPGRATVLYLTYLLIFILLYGGVLTSLPFLLDAEMGLTAVGIGLILTVASAATGTASALNGRLAQRFTDQAIAAVGVVALGIGLLGLWASSSPVGSGVAILAFGAGMGLSMPSLDTAVSYLVPGTYRGGAMSLRTSMVRLGQTIGPPLFTALAVLYGHRLLLLAGGAAGLVLGLASLLVMGSVARPATEEGGQGR